jgi:hypothetical protein
MAHVYYFDGGQVLALERDGVTHVVARVPSGPRLVSAFSVSGFEQRIAVSVLDSIPILASPSAIRDAAVEGGGDHIVVGGRLPDSFSHPSGTPAGWLDDEHLLFKTFQSGKLSVLHVHNGSVTSVP